MLSTTIKSKTTINRIAWLLLTISLATQIVGAIVLIEVLGFDLVSQGDAFEYVGIADNVLQGNGYALESVAPWRPTASRPPGGLLVNVPFRLLFGENDALAATAGKVMLLGAALLVAIIARYFGAGKFSLLAGAVFTLIPAVMYYTVNPYSSQLPYLLSFSALYASSVLVMQSRRTGVLLLVLSSMFSISVRAAALFPLMGLVMVGLVLSFVLRDRETRRKLRVIAVAIFIGTSTVFVAWSFRNLMVFGSFKYTSVGGLTLLRFNAQGMIPFLDEAGRREVAEAAETYPIYVQRYHGEDQLDIASSQGREALRLIARYPWAFLVSHMAGSLKAFFFFDVTVLDDFFGQIALSAVAVYQFILTSFGLVGILDRMKVGDPSRKALMLLMLTAGAISVLTVGVVGEPRFRLPLEIPIALGCVFFLQDRVTRMAVSENTVWRFVHSRSLLR